MKHRFLIPPIADSERTPLVIALLGVIEGLAARVQQQDEEIALLKDEIRILKGGKKRPHFKPSKMEERTEEVRSSESSEKDRRRPGSDKRSKTAELVIHEEQIVQPKRRIPKGSRFKGYRDIVIQDLVIRAHNTRYRLARWLTPQGDYMTGEMPEPLAGQHFGTTLRSYVLYQHHLSRDNRRHLLHDALAWEVHLSAVKIEGPRHRQIATEGALLGELAERGLHERLAVVSDDAGQFNVLRHGLCWIHAERLIHTLLPLNDDHREDIAESAHDI